jgi:serine/threonine protein kinase
MYYFGRYELQPGPYRHQSENSLVKLAWDHEDKKRVVALKFINSKIQFEREIFRRSQTLLSPDFVIQAMRSHDGDSDLTYRQETVRKGFGIYPYCVVLAAAERDLQSIIQHEFFSGGRDLNVIRSTCTEILLSIQHLHTKGVIHGDIKPLNLMREYGAIKFIDFGASVSYAKLEFAGGVRTSSAYLPPEMVRITPITSSNENENTIVPTSIELDTDGSPVDRSINEYKLSSKTGLPIYGESTVELLKAHPSMDIWSFGVLFYYICTGETLFLSNVEDEIDIKQLQILSFWPEEFKAQRLSLIVDPILKCLTAQLLNKEPRRRPKVKHILNHPFFTRVVPPRLPGMPATYDICLVYRRKEKRAKAKQADEERIRKDKEAERQRLMEEALENGEEWIEPVEKKKKKMNNYHDDKHVDDFRVFLESRGFSVCDCYDEDGIYEEGNGLNIIKSKAVIVILSRFAINFDVNNFENLSGDSSYDHLLFQLRLAIELKSLGLIEGLLL